MTWTDERLDERFNRVDRNFDRMWEEFRELRAQFSAELRSVRSEIAADRRQSLQMSWLIIGILVTQLVVYALMH
jgi:hypothetical protein